MRRKSLLITSLFVLSLLSCSGVETSSSNSPSEESSYEQLNISWKNARAFVENETDIFNQRFRGEWNSHPYMENDTYSCLRYHHVLHEFSSEDEGWHDEDFYYDCSLKAEQPKYIGEEVMFDSNGNTTGGTFSYIGGYDGLYKWTINDGEVIDPMFTAFKDDLDKDNQINRLSSSYIAINYNASPYQINPCLTSQYDLKIYRIDVDEFLFLADSPYRSYEFRLKDHALVYRHEKSETKELTETFSWGFDAAESFLIDPIANLIRQ